MPDVLSAASRWRGRRGGWGTERKKTEDGGSTHPASLLIEFSFLGGAITSRQPASSSHHSVYKRGRKGADISEKQQVEVGQENDYRRPRVASVSTSALSQCFL